MHNGWVFIRKTSEITVPDEAWNETESLSQNEFFAARSVVAKFEKDRIFLENDQYVLIVDGVIMNNHILMQQLGVDSWQQAVETMLQKEPDSFFQHFRGTFNGLVYWKSEDRIMAFVDHSGTKNLYYSSQPGFSVVTSDFSCISDLMKANGISRKLFRRAVDQMLTYGYMLDGSTFIEGVTRVSPGDSVIWKNGSWKEQPYHRFDNTKPLKHTEQEWIALLDDAFRRSVSLEFEKDREYGYAHLVDMSGGLDSRMVAWVAHDLGYHDMLNISYSQSGSDDHKVAKKVAKALQNQFVYMPLDDADFLFHPEETVLKNFGQNYYASITGGNRILNSLDLSRYGMEHTGLLGDMEEGSFACVPEQTPSGEEKRYRFSKMFDLDMDPNIFKPFPNQEMCWFYIRGLIAGFGTNPIRQHYTETYGPFIDVEFQTLYFSIPIELRMGGLLKRWMIQKYPEAVKIPYARYGCRITMNPVLFRIYRKYFYFKRIRVPNLLKRFGIQKVSSSGMNPFDYWYHTNERLRLFVNGYLEKGIRSLHNDPQLQQEIRQLREQGKLIDKLTGITILCAKEHYID